MIATLTERLSGAAHTLETQRAAVTARISPTYDELAERGEEVGRAALETLQRLRQRAGSVADAFTLDFSDMTLDFEDDSVN